MIKFEYTYYFTWINSLNQQGYRVYKVFRKVDLQMLDEVASEIKETQGADVYINNWKLLKFRIRFGK